MKPDGRILVIGAGVNGSVCAAALHRAGCDVTVLARGKRLEELQKGGIKIEDPLKGTCTVTQVPVVDHLAPDNIYEYMLVIVRKNQVRDLLPVLAQNQSPSVVFMVNTASGPEEWIAALGAKRVMLGFVFAGGRREGSLIPMRPKWGRTPFGDANGAITERLTRLVSLLNHAGLKGRAIADMPDWLVTHAAMVAPVAMLILKHGCDTYALAHSNEDMKMLVEALRETLAVLRATSHRIVPHSSALVDVLPRFVVMRFFRTLLSSRYGEIGAGWHCSQAPDEMFQLPFSANSSRLRNRRSAFGIDSQYPVTTKGSVGAGGLAELWPRRCESLRAPPDLWPGCKIRLDNKQSRGAAVVSACLGLGRRDSG